MIFFNLIIQTKIQATPLSDVYFSVYSIDSDIPEFKFYFDKNKKIIKVIDRMGKNYLDNKFNRAKVLEFKLYSDSGMEKVDVSLFGICKGDTELLKHLENKPFKYGDVFKIYSFDYKNIKIEGDIKDFKGFTCDLGWPSFIINEDGFEVIYTMPPTFQGVDDIRVILGSCFDALEGVSATSDLDGDLTDDINVIGNVNTKICGKYKLEYSVEDSYYNKVKVLRNVIVVDDNLNGIYPELTINNHKAYFRNINRKINKFIIKFKDERNDENNGRGTKRSQ
ncbi:MAG: immunoglobulin-like domain-containing protein [Sarcina sp.]